MSMEPDLGPYEIEADIVGNVINTTACHVVDLRQPNPDPNGEGGKGFAYVFSGTFAECDAWIEAQPTPETAA